MFRVNNAPVLALPRVAGVALLRSWSHKDTTLVSYAPTLAIWTLRNVLCTLPAPGCHGARCDHYIYCAADKNFGLGYDIGEWHSFLITHPISPIYTRSATFIVSAMGSSGCPSGETVML